MPRRKADPAPGRPGRGGRAGKPAAPSDERARAALAALERMSTRRDRDNLKRFGIDAVRAFGVSMANVQALAKRLGRDHALAAALWDTGWYEARLLTSFVDEPERVTRAQMDRWSRDFDNWGICDTLCFCLFDRTPHAWDKARQWASSPREFVKRAAFALMASLAGHDKTAADGRFLSFLPLIEAGAGDERDLVQKGVSWALRRIGRRSSALNVAALGTAGRIAASKEPAGRWVGRDALRELSSPKVRAALARAAR